MTSQFVSSEDKLHSVDKIFLCVPQEYRKLVKARNIIVLDFYSEGCVAPKVKCSEHRSSVVDF